MLLKGENMLSHPFLLFTGRKTPFFEGGERKTYQILAVNKN